MKYRKVVDKDGNPILDADGKEQFEEIPAGEDDGDDAGQGSGTKPKKGDSGFKPITSQEDFDAMIADRLDRARKNIKSEVVKQLAEEADAEAAKKNGDYKKLYEAEKAKVDKYEAEAKERDAKDLRAKIAKDVGLPEDAIHRLQGETEDDLTKDAKNLLKMLAPTGEVETDLGASKNSVRKPKAKEQEDMVKPDYWGLTQT
jgi:DNA-binding transcriptional regulator GbsR (MarR family)